MKKHTFLWVLTGLSLITLLITSCAKEEAVLKADLPDDLALSGDERLEQQILTFCQRCKFLHENPGVKSSGIVTADSALWDIEAALNFVYSHQGITCDATYPYDLKLTLDCLPDGKVDNTEIAELYYEIIDSLVVFYNNINVSGKKVLVSDIEVLPTVNPLEINLMVHLVIGREDAAPAYTTDPFGTTDYWFYGFSQGKCGQYYGQGFGSDAAREIEKLQHNFITMPPANYRVYYTDIENFTVKGNDYINPNDVIPNDNMYDYLMFFNNSNLPNFHQCLSPEEMNFYFHNTYYILTNPNMIPSQTNPPGKDFIGMNLTGENIEYSGGNCVMHKAFAKYGIPHYAFDPSYPVPDPNY